MLSSLFAGRSCIHRPFYSILCWKDSNFGITFRSCGGGEELVQVVDPTPEPLPPREIVQQPKIEGEDLIQQAVEQIVEKRGSEGKGGGIGFGCFWAPGLPQLEFLFCFDTGDLVVPPFLFHYSFKRGVQRKERLNWVESISKTYDLRFKNGTSGQISPKLKPYFSWLWKYQPTFNPNERCKITKKGEEVDPKNYELVCETPSGSKNPHKWTKDIPISQVVKPTIDLNKQAENLIK